MPGKVQQTPGGVARNICECLALLCNSDTLPASARSVWVDMPCMHPHLTPMTKAAYAPQINQQVKEGFDSAEYNGAAADRIRHFWGVQGALEASPGQCAGA